MGKFFAGICYSDSHGKKARLYVGKVMQRFLQDFEGPTISLTLSCLKPGIGYATVLDKTPLHLPRDIDDFKDFNLIAGPLEATAGKGKKWQITDYPKVGQTFDKVMKLDCQSKYNKLFPKL